MQDSIALVCSDFPILHFEMIFPKNTHLQSPKISIEITPLRFWRARKRHKPQSFAPAFANSQPAHQTLKSSPLLLGVNRFLIFDVVSKLKIKSSSAQFSGD
jgi:hypothetical protein